MGHLFIPNHRIISPCNFYPTSLVFWRCFFFIWQIYPLLKIKSAQGKHAPALNSILSEDQQKHPQILLYFMSPHCGMCRNITPIVDKLATQRTDILRVDLYENMEIARDLGVIATPAFVLLQDGVIEKVKLGGLSEDRILGMFV